MSRWWIAAIGSLLLLALGWLFRSPDPLFPSVHPVPSPTHSAFRINLSLLHPSDEEEKNYHLPLTTQIREGNECLKPFGLTQSSYTPEELIRILAPTQPPRVVRHTRQYTNGKETVALQISPVVTERESQSLEPVSTPSPSRAFRVRVFEIEKDGFPVLKSDQDVDDVTPIVATYGSFETILDEQSLQMTLPQGLVTLSIRNGQIEWFDLPSASGMGPVRCETDRDESSRNERLPLHCLCSSRD